MLRKMKNRILSKQLQHGIFSVDVEGFLLVVITDKQSELQDNEKQRQRRRHEYEYLISTTKRTKIIFFYPNGYSLRCYMSR